MKYHEALKIYFNKTGKKYYIPKSNSKEHKNVMDIMNGTKNIKNDTLIDLKNMIDNDVKQAGCVILNTFFHKTLESRPKILNDLITLKGDVMISKIEVCRNPIKQIFEKLINIASIGMLNRTMNTLGYDRLYHLYLVLY